MCDQLLGIGDHHLIFIDQCQLQIIFYLFVSFHVSNSSIRTVIAIATNFGVLVLQIAVSANNVTITGNM